MPSSNVSRWLMRSAWGVRPRGQCGRVLPRLADSARRTGLPTPPLGTGPPSLAYGQVRCVSRASSHGRGKWAASFTRLDGDIDRKTYESKEFIENKETQKDLHAKYKTLLEAAMAGGGEKAIERHVRQNKKLLAEERLRLMLDNAIEWLELSPLAGMGMEYGSVPRAGIITGIGKVEGRYCTLLINDATVKGGTIYPVSVKKQLRAQEIAMKNQLPCIYIVDSGGAFLPLQADIFPDKEQGGRAFYNEAILNSMNIPQVAIVCGSCTAGGAYVPTMCQETVIVDRVGTIFLGGPPLVYAALGEVVSAEDLGGANLHCSVSGATDHFAKTEMEAFTLSRNIVETFNMPIVESEEDYSEPVYDPEDLCGLIPAKHQETMDMYKVISRIVDESCFQEFKARYGPTLITGFAHIEGNLVGIVANNGPITGDAATKGSHFVQLCSQRQVPLIFLQNTPSPTLDQGSGPKQADAAGIELRMQARLMTAVACTQVPKLTVIVGNSFGPSNYMMGGRSFDPRFVFSWPNAKIGIDSPENLIDLALKAKSSVKPGSNDEDLKQTRDAIIDLIQQQTSAFYSSSRLWDDGIILPQQTRQVLGRCLRIVKQSQASQQHQSAVIRM